jgi:putative cofactor-binding repeat protein
MGTKISKLGLVILIVFAGSLVLAGDLQPGSPPGSTMKTLDEVEPRIPITSWPFDINQPGSYYLANNLLIETFINGITIDANDVTIDLMGHKIELGKHFVDGEYYGIKISGKKNIKIHNGTIRGFNTYGIYSEDTETEGVEISSMRIIENESCGIYLRGLNHKIKNCFVADNNSVGIILSGDNHLVQNCNVSQNSDTGISFGNDTNIVKNCRLYKNGLSGINNGGLVVGCTAQENAGTGIYANKAKDNISSNNGYRGIFAETAIGNQCNQNGHDGIYFKRIAKDNECLNNAQSGIYVTYSGAVITGNTCRDNTNHGIFADCSAVIVQNGCYSNNGCGISTSLHCVVKENACFGNNNGDIECMDPDYCIIKDNIDY